MGYPGQAIPSPLKHKHCWHGVVERHDLRMCCTCNAQEPLPDSFAEWVNEVRKPWWKKLFEVNSHSKGS